MLFELVRPWAKSNWIVVADLYFVSVEAVRLLYKHGLCFIRVVKIATRGFLREWLASRQMSEGWSLAQEWYM